MSTLTLDEAGIKETLLAILAGIAPEADLNEFDHDDPLQPTLDIDSFDFLNVLIALEEQLGVSIPEADYGRLVSLNDIVAYVTARAA